MGCVLPHQAKVEKPQLDDHPHAWWTASRGCWFVGGEGMADGCRQKHQLSPRSPSHKCCRGGKCKSTHKAASSSTENTYVLLFCLIHEIVLGFLLLLAYFLGNRMTQKAYEIMIYNQGKERDGWRKHLTKDPNPTHGVHSGWLLSPCFLHFSPN